MRGVILGTGVLLLIGFAVGSFLRTNASRSADVPPPSELADEGHAHTVVPEWDRAPGRVLIAAGALPEGFSDEPVYTLNGAEYLDEETKWAWAYGAASLEEIVEARDAMRFVYFDLALPELSKAMKDPERTKEIGDANADGSWSFQPGGVLPNSVWKQDGKVFLSVLTEEQHPSICEVRREFLWLDDRMRILEVAAFKKHVADKGPGYDHSECTPAEKLGIEGSD